MPESSTKSSADQSARAGTPEGATSGPRPGLPADIASVDRRASVWDVLHGLEVRDFLETLPSEMWEQLFPSQNKQD